MTIATTLLALFGAEKLDYSKDVRPLLAEKCFACHGLDEHGRKGALRLDTLAGATGKGESGATALVPGKPAESEMLRRMALPDDDPERMPPLKAGARLKPEELAKVKQWIVQGAEYQEHWAFVKPVKTPEPPPVKNAAWPRGPLDRFILARLEKEGLSPSPEADRRTLARRWALDLIGLPPTPQQVEAFVADAKPGAEERYVDRLLADPAFGERWARVWMDLARYADSAGYGSDPLRPDMHRFRDWTIEAFNRNEPYDRFSIKQLAGDLLPNATDDDRLATAFHRNTMTNTEGGTDDEEFRTAAVKDRAIVTMQVWMGLTAGCAQCHSHKFDPLSQKEFYQLYAFFNQTADADRPGEEPKLPIPTVEQKAKNAEIDGKIAALRERLTKPSPGQAERQAAWEKTFDSAAPQWRPLAIASAKADSGATAEMLPDGSVRFLAPAPKKPEGYTVALKDDARGLTAVKLEAIPDPKLPNGGAGRGPEGNFVLSEIGFEAVPADAKQVQARFVRIELPGKQKKFLQLAEVQVFRGKQNLALKGTATQSSTYEAAGAARAIDGKTDGRYDRNSVAHTAPQENPWWEIDLGSEQPLERVAVWNRAEAGDRLAGFRILALDAKRQTVWQTQPAKVPAPNAEYATGGASKLAIAGAWADHEQPNFPVASLVRGDAKRQSGWAVGPRFKEPHHAVFAFAAPVGAAGRLQVRLDCRFKDPQSALGRFRLLGTSDANIGQRSALPTLVAAALAKPAGQRSPAESAALATHFREQVEGQALQKEIAALEAARPKPIAVPVLVELPKEQRRTTRFLEKGSFLSPGPVVEALPPAAFGAWPKDAPLNRLGLSQWLFEEGNPLTARVAANRWWARMFGRGLVDTEEDFGTQGEPPSHPELLDWLAAEYRRGGWDTKAFLKMLALSATYRQASAATPALLAKDPANRLLARAPRIRLEAEAVRDQALALSGLLNKKIGGPSVFPVQPPNLWQAAFNGQRSWTTSTNGDQHRRGLYTFWRRTVPYPSMATFDAPSRESCTLRRIPTNTALQAFVTLNDPAYVECAQALARRLVAEGGKTPAERVAFGLKLCTAREPDPKHIARLTKLHADELARYAADPAAAKLLAGAQPMPPGVSPAELAAWTVVANVLLNLDAVLTKG